MWRSRVRVLLLRFQIQLPTPPPLRRLTGVTCNSYLIPSRWQPLEPPPFLSRSLASTPEPVIHVTEADQQPEDEAEDGAGGEDSLSSLWEESVGDDGDAEAIFGSAAPVPVTDEEVERVRSVLEVAPEDQLASALGRAGFDLSEELVARAMLVSRIPNAKLLAFFNFVCKNYIPVRSARNFEVVVSKICDSEEIEKMDAYKLWDLVKGLGCRKGFLTVEVLNKLIAIFRRLEKAKAALDVFDKFDAFGCTPDSDSYYLTIAALEKKSMVDAALRVYEGMINTAQIPDGEKVREILMFFCKKKKVKEAHLIYLAAKDKGILLPTSALDFLVAVLSRKEETVRDAIELLEDYKEGARKYAGRSFSAVIQGLCKANNVDDAKKLLMKMVNLGPPPGSAAFNYVIAQLSKLGEMEDALGLVRIMESRGLRPDIFTYGVIMSGYARGGMMTEAHDLLRQAKKRHSKMGRVPYHVLIRGYCKVEEFEKALECLKEMKEDGVQPNTDEYNKLIQSLCLKALDWKSAEDLLNEMEREGLCLKGITRSLIAATRELAEEELQSNASVEA